ncbi:hypothetical protein DXG01_012719 [Tephrocybe rancida]|nr:hypothetical protein DXG01_012719 [Tephrocybe rancida]
MAPTTTLKSADPKSKFRLFFELNRLHKFPAGIELVFWPCAWALAMASYHTSRPFNVFLGDLVFYAFASTLVHSAACVLNDICDRDLDAQDSYDKPPVVLERTKNRPIASGAISVNEALVCLTIEVVIGLAMLVYPGDPFKHDLPCVKFIIGLIGIFPLHGLYPIMKRYTNWPQAWLGLAMNWGFVVVWVYLVPEDRTYILPACFFAGTICWTIVYDTIYACQDRVDDIKAGNNSTAVLFGDNVRPILALFAAAFIAAIAYAGILNQHGPVYHFFTVGGAIVHLLWQLITLKPEVPADCWQKFKVHLKHVLCNRDR